MSRAVLADTGPLYAAADPQDAHHRRAHQELKRLARDRRGVLITYPTLLEAYTLVLYRLGRPAASNWLNDVLTGSGLLNPDPEDYRTAVRRLTSFEDQPITLFAATLAVVSDRLGIEVWTYDHHFDLMRTAIWR
jgi:predicted nucleic acid-binding protein